MNVDKIGRRIKCAPRLSVALISSATSALLLSVHFRIVLLNFTGTAGVRIGSPRRGEHAAKMKAVSIKRGRSDELLIDWQDGHQSRYLLAELRDHCPCASCSGEQVLFRSVEGAPQDRSAPGRNELTGIRQVGSYAIQLEWKDGHSTGIYAWDYLRGLCPCDECSAAHGGQQ